MIYKGSISGMGNATTRENEITADGVAIFRHFAVSHESGVLSAPNHDFEATIEGFVKGDDDGKTQTGKYSNTVHVTDGMLFAYGYFAYAPAADFTFFPPAVEQWHVIYAEINRSVIPNVCTIKTKNNQGSARILANTFRQDELSIVKTGVYQLPLWSIRVTNEGIEVEDLRTNDYKNPQGRTYDLRKIVSAIGNVVVAERAASLAPKGTVKWGVTYETADDGDSSYRIANCEFVQREVHKEIMR